MADDNAGKFRDSYSEWDYESYTWEEEDGTSATWAPCKASLDMPKIGRDSGMFGEYTVTAGMRVYDPTDLTTFVTVATADFTYTLAEPAYDFGDEFEFDERPYEDAVFTEYNDFDLSLYIDGAEGTGFQKAQGLFKAVPKFETTLWIFKLTLEMPSEYFDSTNYLWQYVTYEETTGVVPKQTVSCGLNIGDATSAEVIEYDETFDASTEQD